MAHFSLSRNGSHSLSHSFQLPSSDPLARCRIFMAGTLRGDRSSRVLARACAHHGSNRETRVLQLWAAVEASAWKMVLHRADMGNSCSFGFNPTHPPRGRFLLRTSG